MDQRLTLVDRTNRGDDLRGLGIFQQISSGASAHQIEDVLLLVIHGQRDDSDVRELAFDLSGRLDSAHPRHAHIHQHDVGHQRLHLLDGFHAILGLAHDMNVVFRLEDCGQSFAHDAMVIRDEHLNLFHERSSPF